MRMRRIIVVLAALLALSSAPAYAATRAGVFETPAAICACLVSEQTQTRRANPRAAVPDSTRPPAASPRRIADAETDTRFQRPPPSR
jgi:hypothetical protein